MESPSQNPPCLTKPGAYDNKAELLRQNPCRLWLSLTRGGAGLADSRLTFSRDPSALLREVPLPLSFSGAPPPLQETWPPLEVRTAGKCLWLGSRMLSKNLQVLILKRRGSRAQNVACCACFVWNFIIKKVAFLSRNFVSLRFEFWKLVAFFRANENSRTVKCLYWLKSADTLRSACELKKPGKAGM